MEYLIRTLLLLSLSSTFVACGSKSSEEVFPTEPAFLACGQGASQTRFIVEWENGTYSVEEDRSPESFRQGFVAQNLALIKHVDYDYQVKFRTQEIAIESASQSAAVAGVSWGPDAIQAPDVWSQGVEGSGVVVGVIDGMVDVNHNQLAANIAVNSEEIPDNSIDDDNNGYIDDYKGVKINSEINDPVENRHGTHVAGIVAADPNFGPVAGVAPKAQILPAQFIGNDGGGSVGDAVLALNYLANRGVKIINMSWGLGSCVQVPTLKSTLKQLSDRSILLVTASGNGDDYGFGVNMDVSPAYPSAYNFDSQISVAASDKQSRLVSFSNYGLKSVHVAAPGAGIYSTTPNNQVETMSGTSMAAPMVSGIAALLWSAIPTATVAQIKQAIINSVTRNSASPLKVYSGGVVNAYAALAELKVITGH